LYFKSNKMQPRIKFNNRKYTEFVAELQKSVSDYFEVNNISKHANARMVVKTICMLTLYFGPYFLILFGHFSTWTMLCLACIMGTGLAGIGFSIAHDALHSAYSSNEKINRILGSTMSLVGANDYMWKIKHNIKHHTFTNIYERDEDLSVVKFLRLSPHAPHRAIHRLQHIVAFFAYSMLSLSWVFYTDYNKIFRYKDSVHPRKEIIKLLAFKVFYYSYILVIPLLVLPLVWWKVLIGFAAMHLVGGFIITIIFQLAHVIEDTAHPEPEEGLVDNAWIVHQMETTANFAIRNPVVTWFVGGLNFQVEHHLFPRICSIHYPEISPIVESVARKHNIAYYNHYSLLQAIASHYRTLRKFGKSPE
jgi:linoleoyl-CoA desaturase